MKASFLLLGLAALLLGCSTYGSRDVASREARVQRLYVELERCLPQDMFSQLHASWQEVIRTQAECERAYREFGIPLDKHYKLRCELVDLHIHSLSMLRDDWCRIPKGQRPNQAVELTAVRSAASGSSP